MVPFESLGTLLHLHYQL